MKFKIIAAVIILVILFTELSSFVFFEVFQDRFTFHNIEKLLFKKENLQKAEKVYDRDLGWLRQYPTPFGERYREKDYGRGLIATYGDSYTHCDQVRYNQTFQTYLSKKLKADVYNFGVGGYGTDQAFLRFRRDYSDVNTPVVILGLITENINRVVNVFRRFYYQKTELSLPKPRFQLKDQKLELLPNPVQNLNELPKLLDPEYISTLGKSDWWYNKEHYPELEFPYTRILSNKRLWLEAIYGKAGEQISDTNARPWEDLWQDPEPRDLMFAIFDAFVSEVKEQNAVPVILLLPRRGEVVEQFQGKRPKSVRTIMKYCKKNKYFCVNGVNAVAGAVKSEEDVGNYYTGHLTAAGNMLISDALFRFLRAEKILRVEGKGKNKRYVAKK